MNKKNRRVNTNLKLLAGTTLLISLGSFGGAAKAADLTSTLSNDATTMTSEKGTATNLTSSSSADETSSSSQESSTSESSDESTNNSGTTDEGDKTTTGNSSSAAAGGESSGTSSSKPKPSSSEKPSTTRPSTTTKPSTSQKAPSSPSKSAEAKSTGSQSKVAISPSLAAPQANQTSTATPVATPTENAQSYVGGTYAQPASNTSVTRTASEAGTGDSVYEGPTLKKIQAAKTIDKIDNSSTEAFIKSIAPRIQILAGKNNLFASIILAQAILESGSGQSDMAVNYFNIFNITGSYFGKSISFKTQEYAGDQAYLMEQSFRVYSNYDQSLEDYINLMLSGTTWNPNIYAGSWKTHAKNYTEAAQALQGVFATDPEYAQKLIDLIQEYHLDFYDNVDSKTEVWGENIPTSPVMTSKAAESDFPAYNGVEYPGAESYAFGNCTQYVYNRIIQLGGKIGTHMGNGGEWGLNAQQQGYFTTMVPTEGYAVSFPPGVAGSSSEYGHVAFVEKVYDDHSILVSEMNVRGNNVVSQRHISASVAALATYIQPK